MASDGYSVFYWQKRVMRFMVMPETPSSAVVKIETNIFSDFSKIHSTGIQNRLGGLLDFGFLRFGRRGPWEVVVDHIFGLAVIAFKSATYCTHPGHMNI